MLLNNYLINMAKKNKQSGKKSLEKVAVERN